MVLSIYVLISVLICISLPIPTALSLSPELRTRLSQRMGQPCQMKRVQQPVAVARRIGPAAVTDTGGIGQTFS
jgi:hypothetical protein